ncbi:MAG: sugar phosphorylase [Oceanococcaceae bacterium]
MLSLDLSLRERIVGHLERIYCGPAMAGRGVDVEQVASALLAIMELAADAPARPAPVALWDAREIWLITYADSVLDDAEPPLQTLRTLLDGPLAGMLSGVHILPFYPYSSDHGFAVTDYDQVQPAMGTWTDIRTLTAHYRVMADLVINHCSSGHPWFRNFCRGAGEGHDYIRVIAEDEDLSQVVRPRTSEVRRPTPTAQGLAPVWCTFSHDQVDLDFRNPAVLCAFARILRQQLSQGIRAFRLDAVAFLWKESGTTCLNLPQTHEIVRLLRTLVDAAAPGTLLITETNIPNRENLAYFGNGDEAHIVYNFSLPPLLLHTLWSGSSQYLTNWLMSMPPAQVGTTFLNFLASHDGIGLRPAEGLLSTDEIAALIATAERYGGRVSWRRRGQENKPYELNIALFDALRGTHAGADAWHRDRYLCAHTIMLGLEGIPAFYINSLLAARNDESRFARTGKNRSLNRHQWVPGELEAALADPSSDTACVLEALRGRIALRARQPAFHPDATQFTLHLGDALFGFWRQSLDRQQRIFCISNISAHPVALRLDRLNLSFTDTWHNLLGEGREYASLADVIALAPYETVWISNRAAPGPEHKAP